MFHFKLNQGFTFKDDKLICHACRGITPSKVCEACGGDFAPGEKKVGYQSKIFHEKCFICDDCKKPIGTQQFVRREDKRLCGNCFDSSYAKVCSLCPTLSFLGAIWNKNTVVGIYFWQ